MVVRDTVHHVVLDALQVGGAGTSVAWYRGRLCPADHVGRDSRVGGVVGRLVEAGRL